MRIEIRIDDKVVGWITLETILIPDLEESSEKSEYQRITALWVTKDLRKRGIGSTLVNLAIKRHCDYFEVVTRDAAGFYKKLGFEESPSTRLVRKYTDK